METISKVITAIKDTYLDAVDWVSAHPHWTIWGALTAVAFAAAAL